MKKNKISKDWINKRRRDIYVRQSKIEGYKSRAIYKIKEIDEKFKILNGAKSAVDLGAAPGSWSQYLVKKIKNGKIVSIDLLKIEPVKNTHQIIGDFTDEKFKKDIKNYFNDEVDIVVSDMAVNTTGNKNLDCIRTNSLCLQVIDFSTKILKKKGVLVSKLFMGEDFLEVKETAKKKFNKVEFYKPKSSRSESRETYIFCSILNAL